MGRRVGFAPARVPFFPPYISTNGRHRANKAETRSRRDPLRRDPACGQRSSIRCGGDLGELRCVSRLKRSRPSAQIAQRTTSVLSPKHPAEHPPCATRPKHLPPPNHRAISHIYLAPTGQRKLHARPSTHLQRRPRRSRTAGPRADRPGDQREDTRDPSNPLRRGPCLRAAEARYLSPKRSGGIAAARKPRQHDRCNQPFFVLQSATRAHHPHACNVRWPQRSTPARTPPMETTEPRPRRPGLRRTGLARAQPSRPLSASGPRGHPERVPPCRSAPLLTYHPAVYGMTRSAQVGAPTEGTPVFISRPDTGLSRRSVVLSVALPAYAATARQEVQPAAFAVHNRNASTRLPTTTTARLPPPPAERQKPNGQAAAATQNSGGSRGRSRRTLRGAYRLRPEFCSAQAYAQGGRAALSRRLPDHLGRGAMRL